MNLSSQSSPISDFLILRPDTTQGRGTRGANLHRFLQVFHGHQAVRTISVAELTGGRRYRTEVLFVGLPTGLRAEDLAKVTFRRAALFDYGDVAGPDWGGSDQALLRSVSDLYLKAWVEKDWDFGLRWGVLPIRRHRALTWYLTLLRGASGHRYPELFRRDHDVSFLGNCTAYHGTGVTPRYPQRVEWLREIAAAAPSFSFWGGLQGSLNDRARLQSMYGDLGGVFFPGNRMWYPRFFHHLMRSKVALAPAGNARWTYRHFEAIYAGAVLVSTDLRKVRTLIPLPNDHLVHVEDRASVLPAIERALGFLRDDPDLPRSNIDRLEGCLTNGDYHRSKPLLRDRFLAQLDQR